jgi:peptide/nickel transport system substrate-binding protein
MGWVTLTVLLSASAVAFVDVGSGVAETVKRGGTLNFARPDEPLTFDPFVPNDNGSIYALEQVCDLLVGADSTGRGLRPGLAESWDISGDGLTYTFKIRDAKFNNGDPVTVDDVVFSLQSLADPKRSMSFILKPVKSVEAMDDKHVKVTLSEPCAPMPSAVYASGLPEPPPEPPKTPLTSHPTTRSGPTATPKCSRSSTTTATTTATACRDQ